MLSIGAISIGNAWMYLFVFAGLLSLVRAGLGPSFADRFLGIGAFVNVVTLLLVAHAISVGSQFYIDVAILLVMMSFVGSLAIAKYAPRKREVANHD
jgi:multisubunit Na+/H+ antiporter MnhF subunit